MSVHFKIIVPFYNVENWIETTLNSVRTQTYKDFQCILVDDMSTDSTLSHVHSVIDGDHRFKLVVNTEKKYALQNIVEAIHGSHPSDNDVIIILDGDDWLAHSEVLEYLAKVYSNPDCWMTYGSYMQYPSGDYSSWMWEIPDWAIDRRAYREFAICCFHLRTFKAFLWKRIQDKDLRDHTGKYYRMSGDIAVMLPLFEMAGRHAQHIKDVLMVYNKENPINDLKVDRVFQVAQGCEAQRHEKYPLLLPPERCNPFEILRPERMDVVLDYLRASYQERGIQSTWFNAAYQPTPGAQTDVIELHNGFPVGPSLPIAEALLHATHPRWVETPTQPIKPYVIEDEELRDFTALAYANLRINCKGFLIPHRSLERAEEVFKDARVVVKKRVRLNSIGKENLMVLMMEGCDGIGNINDGYSGAPAAAQAFFGAEETQGFYLVDCSFQEADRFKGQFEGEVYYTDSMRQAFHVIPPLLNTNSLSFLNTARPYQNKNLYTLITFFLLRMKERFLTEDYCLGPSATLAAYGRAPCEAIEYFHRQAPISTGGFPQIREDNALLERIGMTVDDVIYNPRNHFYHMRMKCISLELAERLLKP
ncbi:MAG: glycosyltransferase family 2 protein [Chlamydiia bacterium]|nr:glycosyltransferase family 2 protein [Chlamydiia bacterium]